MEEYTTIKCSLPGKLNPENSASIRPLIEHFVEHGSRISHIGSLIANKYLIERCRLGLAIPRLDSVFFRQCMSIHSKKPRQPIDGLEDTHSNSFDGFPKLELKTGVGVVVDAVSKQQSINFKVHCTENLLKIQKRFYKAILRQQELDEKHWWHMSNQVNNMPCRKQVPDEIVFNQEVIDVIKKDIAFLDAGNKK